MKLSGVLKRQIVGNGIISASYNNTVRVKSVNALMSDSVLTIE